MSTTFRLFKSCSTSPTISRSRAGTCLITLCGHTTLHVVPRSVLVLRRSSTLDLHPLSLFLLVCIAGVAAQKSCKRRIHVASSTSSSTTTQLPGTLSSSTGTLSRSDKLHSLYAHASRRTRSASSAALSIPVTSSKRSSQESQSETSEFTNGTSKELASHLNKTFGGALVFPAELATRLLTHASHPASKVVGHNTRFAFIGECRPLR